METVRILYRQMASLEYVGAKWCTTCKTIQPKLEELAKRFHIALRIYDYDELTEDEKDGITKVPTVRIKMSDKVVETYNVNQVSSVETWLKKHIVLQTEQTEDF